MISDNARELEILTELLAHSPAEAEYLLPVLQEVQSRVGHVSPGAIRMVADAFNLSRAEVHGVVSFYHDLRLEPVGEHVVQLCMAEACQSVGCRALAKHAESTLGVSLGKTTSDRRVHLEAAYCFGNCALGPTIRIGDRIIGGVTPEKFDTLVSGLRASTGARA